MLKVSGITLDPVQHEGRPAADQAAEFERIGKGNAGPPHFGVDVDEHMDGPFGRPLCREHFELAGVVDGQFQAGDLPVEPADPGDLPRSGHGGSDQDVLYARLGQGFRLGKFGGADTGAVAGFELTPGDLRTFMGLGVRPQLLARPGGEVPHDIQVLLEQIQIEDQRRGIQLRFQHKIRPFGFSAGNIPPIGVISIPDRTAGAKKTDLRLRDRPAILRNGGNDGYFPPAGCKPGSIEV